MSVSFLPEFVTTSASERVSLPLFRLYLLWKICGFLPEERLFYPVRAIRIYLDLSASVSFCPYALFMSPGCPTRVSAKNALSFFLGRLTSMILRL